MTSLSGADVAKSMEQENVLKKNYESEVERVSDETQKKADTIKKIVNRVANPHPLTISLAILIVLGSMYLIYILFIKPCLDGSWIDGSGVEYSLKHDKLTGRVDMTAYKFSREINKSKGEIIDNYIVLAGVPGVWDYADNIMLFNGVEMKRFR
jgi:hypothetical protein